MFARVGLASIQWLDEVRQIEIVVSDGNDALIGTELLQETMLVIDYASSRVTISAPV